MEPSPEVNPREQVETESFRKFLDACASDDFYLRQDLAKLNPIYKEVEKIDFVPIPSSSYLDALKILDGRAIKKIENTKPFGVDVGQRSGQPYLVRACLDADFRKYFRYQNTTDIRRRLENSKLGWSIVQNKNMLLYQQVVMTRTDKLSPAIYILWLEEEIHAVRGMILSMH